MSAKDEIEMVETASGIFIPLGDSKGASLSALLAGYCFTYGALFDSPSILLWRFLLSQYSLADRSLNSFKSKLRKPLKLLAQAGALSPAT
jgi:hypothetical protein